MSKTVRIRFVGLAALGNTSKEMIERRTGYTIHQDGNDWVVYDDDPQFKAPPKRILTILNKGLLLSSKSYEKVADECLKFLHPVMEKQHPGRPPKELKISNNWGLVSDLDWACNYYFWTSPANLKSKMVTEVFPRMVALGAERVYPVVIDAEGYYGRIALTKISYVNRQHGLEIAKQKVLSEDVLRAALPSPIDPLNYLDALLFTSPYAFAIPLHRVGSTLFFTSTKVWSFPKTLTSNIFDFLDSTHEPFSTNKLNLVLLKNDLTWRHTQEYLDLAVSAINNITHFLSNPLNFLY